MEKKKPSEYIRIGIGIRPRQLTGFFASGDKSCALGALTEGIAGHAFWWGSNMVYQAVVEPVFPELFTRRSICPVCRHEEDSLAVMVTHLNDSHKWRRERIGEWLDDVLAEIHEAPEPAKRDAVADETPESVEREEELVGV